jgi:hypothetical protein
MADHLDAPGLMSPGMDARIDITDVYAFQKPGNPSKSILMMNVNPLAPTFADEFDSAALYQLNIDTDADAVADIAFRFTFTPKVDGVQKGKVRVATGSNAARLSASGTTLIDGAPVSFGSSAAVTRVGPYKFFAGLRSDPFFFDLLGFLSFVNGHGFDFTHGDFFADKNVFGMVLEVPNSALGSNPNVGIWAACAIRKKGVLTQIDRMGRPAINTVFNHGGDKNTFNSITPDEDRTTINAENVTFLQSFEATLVALGGYSTNDAETIAKILLPDILTYDYSSSAGFLNGRNLTDDVIDIELSLITNGGVTGDDAGPHTDLLSRFPYLGNPHA